MSSTNHPSELESLRSQVADLTRALAEREQAMQAQHHHLEEMIRDLREQSNLLHTIIEGTAAETGDEFFASLVTHLTATLHVQYAVIGEVCEGRLETIRTLAVAAGGALIDNFEYRRAHTPCATTLTQGFACFDRDVQAIFPQFQHLADLGAESYCGVALRTKDGAVIGLLAVMDTKPLQRGDDVKSLLSLFAPRVAVEFERRRTEQEHAQALADLHNVIETVPDVMFTLDITGNLVKWNRRLGDVTGYSPEELLNKPALAFVPLEEQTRTAAAIQRAFVEGYAELDGQMLTKDLRTIPYHWTGALLKNAQGEPIGVTGVGRDVSEKIQVEKELTQQRRHLVDAQALAHLGSWDWDIDTGKVQWSDEHFRIFGREPGSVSVTYDTFLAALLPDDRERVLAAVNDALAGTMSYDIEYRIVRPNGEVRYVHARGDVYRDMTGHPLSMAGTVLDITDRKRIEDALRGSEERWYLAVRGSNDGIWDWNIQTGGVFFSSRWKTMRGFEDHEIKNEIDEWRSRIHPEDLDRVLQSIDAYLAKHTQEFCEEYRVQRKDGSCMWILDRGVALWAEDGTPLRMAGSETDITVRKGAEEALVRSRDLLKSFVEHTPAGVAMLDKDLRYVAVSRRWAEDYRLGDQQVIGRHHYDVFPEIKDMEEWQVIHQRCLSGAVERREEDRFTRADGSEDWLRWEVRPWQDITGEIGGIIMFTEVITERKQAYSLLQATINSTADGLLVVNRQGKVTSANRRFMELWRISNDFLERADEDILLAFVLEQLQEPDAFLHKVRELYSHPDQESFDMLAFKDGRVFERNSRPQILDEEIVGRVWSFRDVTVRTRAEEALEESEERFALAVMGSTDILWDAHRLRGEPWHAPETPIWWSPGVQELLGLGESEPFETLEQWAVRLHPEDKERVFSQLTAHIDQRVPYDAEYRLRTNRGDYRWIRGRGQAMWDEHGEIRRMSGSCQDITDRKRADEALRKSEERYARATAAGKVGVWELDVATGTYHGDTNLKALFGYVDNELSTDPYVWGNLVHPDDQSIPLDHWQRIVNGESDNCNYELRMLKKDGTVIWTDVRGHAVRDHEGQVTHLFGAMVDISERKQAQDALAQSERQLRTVLDALPVGVWFTDQSGKPVLANPAAKQIWSGIRQVGIEDTAIAAGWWEAIRPSSELHRWALSHALTTGVPSLHESLDLECLDGTKKTIRNLAVPVRDEAGVVLGAIVVNEDITALRQAQETLRLTQFSVDHAVEGFFWISPDARILRVNDAACQMLEYSQDELMAMTMPDIDPTLPPEVWPAHWGELKQKGSLTFESKHWSKTGRVLDTEVTFKYLQYEGKEYNCAIMRDIGERKRAEAALRASEERYRSLYDDTPTMYFTLAMDGTVRSVNRFGAEQLGYQAEELIGHSVLGVFHEQDRETAAANLAECFAAPETTRHWEFRKVRKDGRMIWVQETARLAQSGTGETVVLVTCEDVTERKQAEQGLEFFRTLLDHVDDSIEIIDPQGGRFLDGNAKAASNLGYTRDELLALTVPDIDPLVTGPIFSGLIQGLRDAPAPLVLDSLHRRKDGTTFPVEVSAQLIRLDKEYLVAIVRDITERKRVEEALRLAKFSMDRAADAVYWIDAQAKVLDVNEAASLMLGYSKQELCAMTIHDLNPDFQTDMWPGYWAETQRRGTMVIETVHRAKIGRLIPVEVSVNHLAYEGKEYHCVFVRDITERMQAETTLRQSEERYRSLVDNAPIGIFLNDEGRFAYVNQEMQRILKATSAEQLIGTSVFDRIAPEFHQVVMDRVRTLMDNQQPVPSLDEQYVRLDGSRVDVAVTAIPASVSGTPMMQVLVLDIAERKRVEDALRQREGDLRTAIEERERISRDLHDGILQSLFAVGLTLETTKAMMSSRTRKKSGMPLNQAIDQLNRVMHEIRNFIAGLGSDLLQGKDLQTALQHMLDSLTQNQAMHVRLAVEDRAAQAVSVEESLHLLLVIQEAVSNCIRHGRAQEATVSLKMLKQGVRLSIRDNGRGFNPEVATGTGHGLANMAVRARKIGGRFAVMSKVNEGTRIVLDLPKEACGVLR
jgi:PAS domain S-box-containing protein